MAIPEFLRYVGRAAKKTATAVVHPGGDGSDEDGAPGEIGRGGIFSGADPNNPAVMHYGEAPASVRELASHAARAYTNDSTPRAMAAPAETVPTQPAHVAGVGEPVAQGTGPAVSPFASLDYERPAVNAPVQVEGVDDQVQQSAAGPAVSRADANASIREAGLKPGRELFNSGDRLADLEDRAAAVHDYQPQKRGWWENFKAAAPRAALAGLASGGPFGGLGGLLAGATVATADRKTADKVWKAREAGEADGELGREYAREDAALRRRRLAAQSAKDYADAQESLLKPQRDREKEEREANRPKLVERKDGIYLINPATGAQQRVEGIKPEESADWDAVPVGDRVMLYNKRTKETMEASQFRKSPQFKLDDLDSRYGIKSDRDVETEALARVLPNRSRRLTPQGQAMLEARRAQQRDSGEPDDDTTVIQSLLEDGTPMSAIWEGVENDDELKRRVAAEKEKFGSAEAPKRALVARLRTALQNYRAPDSPNAPEVPLDTILEDFGNVLSERDAKKQKAMAEDFFRTLRNANVRQ